MEKFPSQKKQILSFLVTLLVSIGIVSLIYSIYDVSRLRLSIKRFEFYTYFLAKSMSSAYFQWDEIYQAVVNNDTKFLESQIKSMKKEYEELIDATIVNLPPTLAASKPYLIYSNDNLIFFSFNIYDSEGIKVIKDKLVIVKIDPEKILENLGIKNINISQNGRIFTYNLRYTKKTDWVDFVVFSTALFVSFSLIAIYLLFMEMKLRKAEEVHKNALKAIAELSQLVLKGELELSYQALLENAVKIIPGAQAGSVLTKDENGDFIFSAVVGFDTKLLASLKLKPSELAQGYEKEVKIIKKIGNFDKNSLPEEKREKLKNVGRTSEIKATLSMPIVIDDEIVAFLNLDNFENEDAFSELSIEIGRAFASQIGVIFERIKLENELKEQKEKLEYLSLHDALTELPNRRFVELEGERLISLAKRENKKVCIIYLDLKKFKPVNDKYGHKVGDYVIKVAAERFKNVIRKSDLVGRIGGDEFVFLLYDCKDYEQFVERVLTELEKDIYYEYIPIRVSANFGIGIYPDDASSFDELLAKSDMAMYHAKSNNLKYYLASKLHINFED
ncbi:MAG: diguanylate cyclase domain-containing protein [Fervidobacterium sp.]